MFDKVRNIIISNAEPSEPGIKWEKTAWLDTASRKIKTFNGKTWDVVADMADAMPDHTHSEFKDITVEGDAQFNRLLKVGDYEGQTAEIKTEGGVLVFKNGILVKYG